MNAKQPNAKFDRLSEVLKIKQTMLPTKIVQAQGQDEHIDNIQDMPQRQLQSNQANSQGQDSEYLFCDQSRENIPKKLRKAKKVQDTSKMSHASQQQQFVPAVAVKRQINRTLSEPGNNAVKTKPKYNKESNMGNVFVEQAKIDNIFKNLCQPHGKITVNSLGHALQKFQIDFQIKDVVEMLELFYDLKQLPLEELSQDEELNTAVELNQQQFRELYGMTRKSRKRTTTKGDDK